MTLVHHALELLKTSPEYTADARRFAPIGNSVVGSLMSLTLGAPRWATEAAVCDALPLLAAGSYRAYPQMSANQHAYAAYVAANPGCSIADVDRACRRNPQAGHKWVYDGVNRLIRRGVISRQWANGKTSLFVRVS